jgi:hypothetical protein
MSSNGNRPSRTRRRRFLEIAALGSAAYGAAALPVAAQAGAGGGPKRHPQDEWFDQLPSGHRLVLDATTAENCEGALRYANNFAKANRDGYGLKDTDLGIIVVLRHFATVFALNDAMWGKYGAMLSQIISFTDRKTNAAPSTNVYLPSLENLTKIGVHFAVCEMAARVYSGSIARRSNGDADAIYKELLSNLIPNSHPMPAGIVAVNRAQERGYALAYGV